MSSNPPTVADLHAEVASLIGRIMVDTGLFVPRASDGLVPIILQGLRKGAKCVGATIADPLNLSDADVARLSTHAVERVLTEATHYSLSWAILNWYRATQSHQEPLSSSAVASGWLLDEKRAITTRLAELKAILDEPYREPTTGSVVLGRDLGCDVSGGYGYPYGNPWCAPGWEGWPC